MAATSRLTETAAFLADLDLEQWLALLGPGPAAQRKVVEELLYYAGADYMSLEDRNICMKALKRLKESK